MLDTGEEPMSVSKEEVISALAPAPRKAIQMEWGGKGVDTNEELKALMSSLQLKIEDVMRLSMSSYDTVKSWRVRKESKRWRRMPMRSLAHIKIQLGKMEASNNVSLVSGSDKAN